ncbi:kinesin [Lophiotrema nucula]|uniref:Kinesin-like protein n=1 Tax=Lophiotrema nucula TaxID=690887 RepID=A0A6A5Z9A2_9PLEO|nr:kinesin [Lophiotrema nucula]
MAMEPPPRPSSSLFDVFLRLRPSNSTNVRFLNVEETQAASPTHITIRPPTTDDRVRKRAVEKFAFTRVFEEEAQQLELFTGAGVVPLIEGVLGAKGRDGRDGLLATLGVTGSGKSHTILGTKAQRGLTQMSLDVLFQSTGDQLVQSFYGAPAFSSLAAVDVSEARMFTATAFLDSMYADNQSERFPSRAQTPMPVSDGSISPTKSSPSRHPIASENLYPILQSSFSRPSAGIHSIRPVTGTLSSISRSNPNASLPAKKDCSSFISSATTRSKNIPRPSALPQNPSVHDIEIPADPTCEYAIVISMYEVYNDRIFDLLTGAATKNKNPNLKRRALLFKSTEQSPDKKVVAGLTKLICGSFEEAMMVLETGLMERKVAGTGSNAVSSRSHGFFCVEVKKRDAKRKGPWSSSTLTIVDLAGSERARNAKTAGATLAEAGKINESLMYLGQCMQMQSDNQDGSKNIVPFRQCKLTELLFSNSFPSTTRQHAHYHHPQKSIMIVTADPKGDFNATSQILRYSALAREVTVPRIPSTTSTILCGTASSTSSKYHSTTSSGRSTPSHIIEELEAANAENSRLTSEIEVFALRLTEETARRKAAEMSWRAAEDHMQDIEQEIRDECFLELEAAVDAERRRWQAAWDAEADNNETHLDKKIDVVIKATRAQCMSEKKPTKFRIHEDPEPGLKDRAEELELENEVLRTKLEALERESQAKSASPVKKMRALKAKKWEDPETTLRIDDY